MSQVWRHRTQAITTITTTTTTPTATTTTTITTAVARRRITTITTTPTTTTTRAVATSTSLCFRCLNCKKQTSSHNHTESEPIYISSDKGEQWNLLGVKITGKIISSQSNGEYSVIVTETPPEGGPPLHVHSNEDELFYVLKGTYIFTCGKKEINAKQGDFIRLPRGVPHKFVNTDTITGITMNTITPGGFEIFFSEMAKASKNGRPSKSIVDSIAKKYGVQFVKK